MPRPRSSHTLWEETTEAADIALGSAQIAQKAAEKVLDALPVPDPREDVNYQRLAGLEQSMLARISPRHRNRWPELEAIDTRLVELDAGQGQLQATLHELRRSREGSEQRHAEALARWHRDGQKGERPASDAAELDRQIADLDAEIKALDHLRGDVLSERVRFVEKHRKRLVLDAERGVTEAKARYLAAIDAIEQSRSELVELNETRIWASLFPHETLQTMPPTIELAPTRTLRERWFSRNTGDLAFASVLGALRDSADYFAQVATAEQAAAMQDTTVSGLTGKGAMWAGSEEDVAFQRRENQRLREEHARVWGSPPAEFQ